MKSLITLITLYFPFSLCLFAQTGPGGVGTNDGTSTLEIWLLANDLNADGDTGNNPGNGSLVSTWSDYSGNSNNFTQTGINRPSYNSSGTFNAVHFNASLASAQFMYGTITGSYSNASLYFVTKPINSGLSNSLFDNQNFSLRVEQVNNSGFVGFTRYGVSDYTSNIPSPFGVNSILSFHKTAGIASLDIQVNNLSNSLAIGSATAGIPYDKIGVNSNNNADKASGDFHEVILFSSRLNTAQSIIVDNYLSAKYGSISIVNDVYDEDNVGAGNYDFDVAGIGRVNATNFHNDAQGTGIVRILNPTNLDDGEFLIWGHDNGLEQATNGSDVPTGTQTRFDRVWRVSEVNTSGSAVDVGAIDIRFDLTGLGAVTPSDLRLLVDTDNDGVFHDETPIAGATNISGNIYQFSGVTAIANNLRFTLGTINISQTPLPIELVDFSALPLDNKSVLLNWQTASETNNDYFTIERSQDVTNWEEIKVIDGAGVSISKNDYSTIDHKPFTGISYYRLKQTDFDGNFSYASIRSVNLESNHQFDIQIYPNPSIDKINFNTSDYEIDEVALFNTLGKNVSTLCEIKLNSKTEGNIDISKLNPGIYLLRIGSQTARFYKK